MKILLFLVILRAAGCTSPAVRERERQAKATVGAKYDLGSLLAFQEKSVSGHTPYEGMTIPTRFGEGWRVGSDSSMRSVVWIFHEQREKGDDHFVLHSQIGDWYFYIEAKR